MYPGRHAEARADQPAIVMARSGETVTYRELEARSNRLAHLLRAIGLKRLDHYAIFMENHPRFVECCAAGERSGLYYTCRQFVSDGGRARLYRQQQPVEGAHHVEAKREIALAALKECPHVELCLIVDGPGEGSASSNLDEATADFPDTPIADESLGAAMLYSSGTTGRPKGILRPLPVSRRGKCRRSAWAFRKLWRIREGQIYLSPAPLYHSAPLAGVGRTIRHGGTVIVMERFDEEHFLKLVEQHRVTYSQLVPTMFSRMLKLPETMRRRYDLSSLEVALHGAAPCPDSGQKGDDRLVGANYPRILRRRRKDSE